MLWIRRGLNHFNVEKKKKKTLREMEREQIKYKEGIRQKKEDNYAKFEKIWKNKYKDYNKNYDIMVLI